MQPTYRDYCWTVEQIHADVPIVTLRQDMVYELFRRGILAVNSDNRLFLSGLGNKVFKQIAKSEHATELD